MESVYEKSNTREFKYFECNGKKAYYLFDGELYASTFPELWAQTHHPKTGPKNCKVCSDIGCWNGVFLGYCDHCAIFIYRGMRGRGLICYGLEMDFLSVPGTSSINETYMKGISFDDIGDPSLFDSRKIYYPTTVVGEIPTEEKYKYCEENMESISTPTPEEEDLVDEIVEETKTAFVSSDEEDECVPCFGFRFNSEYGSSYDGGYDSY
jgi:hypothetical protein